MKIAVIAVSARQPQWIEAGCDEYLKRMPPDMPVTIRELKPEPRSGGKTATQLMAAERARIEAAIPERCRLVALDERGDDLSTEKLARRVEAWQAAGDPVCVLIGGADGLDPTLKARADETIRLSSLTLPHGLAKLVLCEQIYRASSLLKGHPYHRP
jgi:23S rRNA (pseudouridine1915-N3)-methyltransferase